MKENFLDAAEQILSFKMHKELTIRKMVITLIPTLAVYDTQTFSEHFLHKAMAHLLTQLDKTQERVVAFIAIGHVATAVGSDMKPFLESIMVHVKTGLQSRGYVHIPPHIYCIELTFMQEEERAIRRAYLSMCRDAGASCWPQSHQALARPIGSYVWMWPQRTPSPGTRSYRYSYSSVAEDHPR